MVVNILLCNDDSMEATPQQGVPKCLKNHLFCYCLMKASIHYRWIKRCKKKFVTALWQQRKFTANGK